MITCPNLMPSPSFSPASRFSRAVAPRLPMRSPPPTALPISTSTGCPLGACGRGGGRPRRRARAAKPEPAVYRIADLELDRLSHRVMRSGQEIVLQPREFRLLEYLMKKAHPGGPAHPRAD